MLFDTFIRLLDNEVNNLKTDRLLKDKIDDIIPESEDNVIKNYTNRA